VRKSAELRIVRGQAHAELGAIDRALADFEAAAVAARVHGHDDVLVLARIRIGELVERRGDTQSARACFAEALALATSSAASGRAAISREADAWAALAHTCRREGRLDEAATAIRQSIAAHRALGNDEGLSAMVFEAGVVALFRRHYDEARASFDEALALARRIGAPPREADILTARGTMEQELGELDRARELHEKALGIFRDSGAWYGEASTLYYLGGAHLERGQRDDAETVFLSALPIVRALGVPR
jgi:tetratricopeptide (TPR) repeat protein